MGGHLLPIPMAWAFQPLQFGIPVRGSSTDRGKGRDGSTKWYGRLSEVLSQPEVLIVSVRLLAHHGGNVRRVPAASSRRARLSFMMFLNYVVLGSWYVTLGPYLTATLHFAGAVLLYALTGVTSFGAVYGRS